MDSLIKPENNTDLKKEIKVKYIKFIREVLAVILLSLSLWLRPQFIFALLIVHGSLGEW